MSGKKKTAIVPTQTEDFAQWYQEVIKAAELAEHSPVRGCMIIRPWGYAIWERIQKILDKEIKATGVDNAYFPLFIPLSYFEKEAEHIEGFAKECAVVTHHRLKQNEDKKLIPDGPLEEPLIVRPTSEMIIGEAFSHWITSYRDLPLKINQWANIVRWEMRTRLFLRSAEILWQEGHTAHATKDEARQEALEKLELYSHFYEEVLSIPVISGKKSEKEKFPGAVDTYTVEAMMQDKKALQGGTSHFLGQNFAKSCHIEFSAESGAKEFAWTTSWGMSTRMVGALIMTHGDDNGICLPPKVAPKQIVILPIIHKEESRDQVLAYCEKLQLELSSQLYDNEEIRISIDTRDLRGGEKKWSWIKKGVPILLEIGPKDLEKDSVFMTLRTSLKGEAISRGDLLKKAPECLENIDKELFSRAKEFQQSNIRRVHTKEEFFKFFENEEGFALCPWSEEANIEEELQTKFSVTARCFLLQKEKGKCIFTGKENSNFAIFARAY